MKVLPRRFSVGVLISVYAQDSHAQFVRAIESVLSQDCNEYIDIRVYLAVDGPVDRLISEYIENNVRYFYKIYRSPVNVGLAAMLNHLLKIREDESFYFRMDADDFSLPTRFRKQIDYLQSNRNVGVLGTDIIEVHDAFQRVVRYPGGKSDVLKCICKGTLVAHPTVCFRASVFDCVGLYPEIRGNEDIAMWFKCVEAGIDFDNLHEPLLRFAISKNFWKRRSYSKAVSEFRVYFLGCCRLHGFSFLLVYPILRLLLRFSPSFISRLLYSFRKYLR